MKIKSIRNLISIFSFEMKHLKCFDNSQLIKKKDYSSCNLCKVRVKKLKQHCRYQKHTKIQNELIKIRRDSMYCTV